jgi:hypothetical protein
MSIEESPTYASGPDEEENKELKKDKGRQAHEQHQQSK